MVAVRELEPLRAGLSRLESQALDGDASLDVDVHEGIPRAPDARDEPAVCLYVILPEGSVEVARRALVRVAEVGVVARDDDDAAKTAALGEA